MRISIADLRAYDRFHYEGKVYESRQWKPTEFANWVFLTVWDIELPRGSRNELKFHKGECVTLTGQWNDTDETE